MNKKKLVTALFIEVKGKFDHILRNQLFKCMIELNINRDLVIQIKYYFINQKFNLSLTDIKIKKEKQRLKFYIRKFYKSLIFKVNLKFTQSIAIYI